MRVIVAGAGIGGPTAPLALPATGRRADRHRGHRLGCTQRPHGGLADRRSGRHCREFSVMCATVIPRPLRFGAVDMQAGATLLRPAPTSGRAGAPACIAPAGSR